MQARRCRVRSHQLERVFPFGTVMVQQGVLGRVERH
jgi:hypothetical protein